MWEGDEGRSDGERTSAAATSVSDSSGGSTEVPWRYQDSSGERGPSDDADDILSQSDSAGGSQRESNVDEVLRQDGPDR